MTMIQVNFGTFEPDGYDEMIIIKMIQVNFGTPNRPNLKNVLPPITQQQVKIAVGVKHKILSTEYKILK